MDMLVPTIVRQKCLRSVLPFGSASGSGGVLLSRVCAAVLAAALPAGTLHAAEAAAGPRIEVSTGELSGPMHLIGTEGRRQLVVSAFQAGTEPERDVTRQAAYRVEPESLAKVTPEGGACGACQEEADGRLDG